MAYKFDIASFCNTQYNISPSLNQWTITETIKITIWRHWKMTKDGQKLMNRKVYFWETASPLGKSGEYAVFLHGGAAPQLLQARQWKTVSLLTEQQNKWKFKGEIREVGELQKGWDSKSSSKLCPNPGLTDNFLTSWGTPRNPVKRQAETKGHWIDCTVNPWATQFWNCAGAHTGMFFQ